MTLSKELRTIILGGLILHVLWASLAHLLASPILPYPWAVYLYMPSMLGAKLGAHLSLSLLRVFMGILLALLLASPVALALFRSKRFAPMLEMIIYLSYPIPKLALLPIVMLLFGLGESTKVVMIALITFFQLTIGLRDSLKAIPQDTIHLLRALGANYRQSLQHLYLPAILPDIFSALRIALGTAISVLFVTETYGTSYGMGHYIVEAWMRVDYLDMYGGIIILAGLGFALFLLIDLLDYLCCPWRRRRWS